MTTTPAGITFEELEGSPRVRVAPDGLSAVRRFRVAWDDWQSFAAELYGVYHVVGTDVVFIEPVPFPGGPSNLVVDQLDVEPFDPALPDGAALAGIASGANRYPNGALVTVVYQQLFNNAEHPHFPAVPNGTYLTYSGSLGAEYYTLPGKTWKWAALDEAASDEQSPAILEPVGQHKLTWHRVARPPLVAIRTLRGKVNDATFFGAAAGTLLFQGARLQRQFRFQDAESVWRIEYSFAERRHALSGGGVVGWNYFYNRKVSGGEHWQQIVAAVSPNDPPYAAGDFAGLFQFE